MAEEEKKKESASEKESEETKEETSKEGKDTASDDVSKKEEVPADKAGEEVEVPQQFKKLVEGIENMTVLELHELVKVLERKFGVSAQAVAVQTSGAADAGGAQEQDSFTVELASAGDQKIAVIKAIKEVFGLGLKEAKDMVDGAPTTLKEDVKKAEADEIKEKIEAAGGSVELK